MATFSEHKNTLAAISNEIGTERARLARIRADAQTASANLDAMGSKYGAILAEINQSAADNPSSVARQHNSSEANELIAEWQGMLTEAQAIESAVEGV